MSRTRANMPGRSAASWFLTCARMTMRAARGVDQRIQRDHPAVVRLAGQRVQRDLDRLADLHLPQERLGHAEVDLQRIDRLQVDEVRTLLDVVADRHHAQADDSGERRLDLGLRELRLDQRDRGLRDLVVVLGLVLRLAGDEVLPREIDGAVELGLRQHQVGARLLQLGVGDRGVEPNQRRPLGDALAFLELDRADAAGDLGTQRDRLVRAQAARPR